MHPYGNIAGIVDAVSSRRRVDSVDIWFEALGELESLISFSNLPRVCNNVSIPKFSERKNYIQAKYLGHPLINNDKRVCMVS